MKYANNSVESQYCGHLIKNSLIYEKKSFHHNLITYLKTDLIFLENKKSTGFVVLIKNIKIFITIEVPERVHKKYFNYELDALVI